jgi:peptidyl-prolyl cis-trans isomerase C
MAIFSWIFLLIGKALKMGFLGLIRGSGLFVRGFWHWLRSTDGAALMTGFALVLMIGALAWADGLVQSNRPQIATLGGITAEDDAEGDIILARIDGDYLRLSEVREFAIQAGRLQPGAELNPEQAFRRDLVADAIDQRLLLAAAQRAEMAQEAEIDTRLRVARGRVLSSAFLARQVEKTITDDLIASFYERQKETMRFGDQYILEMLQVADRDSALQLQRNIKGGLTLAEAANSIPQKTDYSPAVEFIPGPRADPAIAEQVAKLSLGAMSAPFATKKGWAIIKLRRRNALLPPEFDDVEDTIRQFLTLDVVEKTMTELREQAQIELFEPQQESVNHLPPPIIEQEGTMEQDHENPG